ncbi:hypothetical protein HGRIS_006396 [Hohenbuehelia grisea]|uniref:Uncharacterized protein n=1 Tax=Hohenbuehelia grisea TaxID=104357 RepID=A0ABR3K2T3_9AGAR
MSGSIQDRALRTTSLDATCRILTLASSVDQAIVFINDLRSRAASGRNAQTDSTVEGPLIDTPRTVSTIPWTISNKYYSADVHFQVRPVAGFSTHHIQRAPAVIFVWSKGEPYRESILRLSQSIAQSEPEVSLAVRLPPRNSTETNDEDDLNVDEEEDSEIDEFLSSHGFEFIDDRGNSLPDDDDQDEGPGFADHGIPGLPRVFDALSTIMWPSMLPHGRPKLSLRTPNRQPLSWASRSNASSLGDSFDRAISGIRLHKEAEDLVRWLEDDPSFRELAKNDPWRSVSEPTTVCASPTSMENALPIHGRTLPEDGQSILGFDDDFTVFVSAPPIESPTGSGQSTPNASFEFGTPHSSGLAAFQPSALYNALGSASDLGTASEDLDAPRKSPLTSADEVNAEEDEEGLPSQKEIAITAARIFGAAGPAPKARSNRKPTSPALERPDDEPFGSSPEPPMQSSLFSLDSLLAPPPSDGDADGLYDIGQFDLSRVLQALRGMKAEIASMEDEGERRRAAAKVALGLVYGFGPLDGDEDDVTC